MSLALYDRVRETTIVLGTSDAVLLGAVTGFQSFAAVGNGNTCYYTIADSAGNWEVGLGTYSTTGPTLARTTVLASSNAGSKVSFPAGTKDVFLTYPAEKAVQLDASDNVSALGNVASATWQANTIATTYGGTGLSSYTAGDMPYYASGNALSKLTIGTSGYVLTSNGSAPTWVAPSSISVSTANNIAGGAANQIVYQSGPGATTFIVAPTVADTYLNWSGSAFQWSNNPLGTVTSVDVSGGTTGLTTSGGPITTSGTITLAGTLALANGGTGATTVSGAQTNLQVDPAGTAVAMAIALG